MSKRSRDKKARRAERTTAKIIAAVDQTEKANATLSAYDGPYDLGGKRAHKDPATVKFRFGEIMAGPYADRLDWTANLCLLEDDPGGIGGVEDPLITAAMYHTEPGTDYHFPIRDFSVPSDEDMIAALKWVYSQLREGRTVYVGCLGGIGRTGTFLACLALLDGKRGAVQWVRDNYLSRAVETTAQEDFVYSLKLPWLLRLRVWWDGIGVRPY